MTTRSPWLRRCSCSACCITSFLLCSRFSCSPPWKDGGICARSENPDSRRQWSGFDAFCGGSEVRIIASASPSCGLLNQSHTSGVDLTFALRVRGPVGSECQIHSTSVSHRRIELQPHHPGDDQRKADDANRIGGLAEDHHSDNDAAGGADACPDRIRSAKWQRSQRKRHETKARQDRDQCCGRGPEPGEAVGIFQAKCPGNFEKPRCE